MTWLSYGLIALAGWIVWGLTSSLAVRHMSATWATFCAGAIEMLVIIAILAFRDTKNGKPRPWPWTGETWSWWILAAGVASGVAYWAFFRALSNDGAAGPVVALTSLYPVGVAALGFAFLGETISLRQGVGIGLAVVAAILVAA